MEKGGDISIYSERNSLKQAFAERSMVTVNFSLDLVAGAGFDTSAPSQENFYHLDCTNWSQVKFEMTIPAFVTRS